MLEDDLFCMHDRLTLSRTRKDAIVTLHRYHGDRLKKTQSQVDHHPHPDCDDYKKYRENLRQTLLDRGGLTPYTIRKCQKPTVVEELRKNHLVHCRRVRHADKGINNVLSRGCESTRARNKLRNRREYAGPVSRLLERITAQRREAQRRTRAVGAAREAATLRSSAAGDTRASMVTQTGADPGDARASTVTRSSASPGDNRASMVTQSGAAASPGGDTRASMVTLSGEPLFGGRGATPVRSDSRASMVTQSGGPGATSTPLRSESRASLVTHAPTRSESRASMITQTGGARPYFGQAPPQARRRPISAPSSRSSPVRPRGAAERRMLEYERRDSAIRFGKLVPQQALPPARRREVDKLRQRYIDAVQRAEQHQTTFGQGHRWALQGEVPGSPTGSRSSSRASSPLGSPPRPLASPPRASSR